MSGSGRTIHRRRNSRPSSLEAAAIERTPGSRQALAQSREAALDAPAEAGVHGPLFLATLAAAYAEGGRFPDAVRVARAAIDLATATGQAALASQTAQHLRLYENALPLHQ